MLKTKRKLKSYCMRDRETGWIEEALGKRELKIKENNNCPFCNILSNMFQRQIPRRGN